MLRILLFCALVLFCGTATASKSEGFGSMSCSDYLEDRADPDKAKEFEHWIQGFVSAYNSLSVRTNNIVGLEVGAWDKFMKRVNDRCSDLPNENGIEPVLISAVRTAIGQTYKESPQSHSEQYSRFAGALTKSERANIGYLLNFQNHVTYIKTHQGKNPGTDEQRAKYLEKIKTMSEEERLMLEDALAGYRLFLDANESLPNR